MLCTVGNLLHLLISFRLLELKHSLSLRKKSGKLHKVCCISFLPLAFTLSSPLRDGTGKMFIIIFHRKSFPFTNTMIPDSRVETGWWTLAVNNFALATNEFSLNFPLLLSVLGSFVMWRAEICGHEWKNFPLFLSFDSAKAKLSDSCRRCWRNTNKTLNSNETPPLLLLTWDSQKQHNKMFHCKHQQEWDRELSPIFETKEKVEQ